MFFQVLCLIARKHNKLVLGLSFTLKFHADDILMAKYWAILTKIGSFGLFSIWIGK